MNQTLIHLFSVCRRAPCGGGCGSGGDKLSQNILVNSGTLAPSEIVTLVISRNKAHKELFQISKFN